VHLSQSNHPQEKLKVIRKLSRESYKTKRQLDMIVFNASLPRRDEFAEAVLPLAHSPSFLVSNMCKW
jgi:hypothetical protein